MVNDRIGDMLNRLKNAGAVAHKSVSVPYSRLNLEILKILAEYGFIVSFEKNSQKATNFIDVVLAYKNDKPRIRGIERVSKQSRRVYKAVKDIRRVKEGYGIEVISTPKGLKTDSEARKEKVGGEALFRIW